MKSDDFLWKNGTPLVDEFEAFRAVCEAEGVTGHSAIWGRFSDQFFTGKLIAFGWRQHDEQGIPKPEQIPARFWIDAYLISAWNMLRRKRIGEPGHDDYQDARVVAQEVPRGVAGTGSRVDDCPIASSPAAQKVPPPKTLRPIAIAACFDSKQVDFDDTNLAERAFIYRRWIEANYPLCDTAQRGLGDSSFEQDETAFKRERRILRS